MAAPEHEIIAGYDGSPASTEALIWAVRDARLRGLPLAVCHAWTPWPEPAARRPADAPPPADPTRSRAEEILAQGVREARACDPAVTVRPLLAESPAAQVLCNQSSNAAMVVVGSRGLGGLAGLLLGSVSFQVAAHAPAPVTVVRGRWQPVHGLDPAPVVVGVDGSAASQPAVNLAIEEAGLRHAPLVALCALSDSAGLLGMARGVEADFQTAIAKARADHPEVLVQTRVEQGSPRNALLTAASRAQLLVVGARGRGGLPDMALGSVSVAVLHHAPCPVTVVHRR